MAPPGRCYPTRLSPLNRGCYVKISTRMLIVGLIALLALCLAAPLASAQAPYPPDVGGKRFENSTPVGGIGEVVLGPPEGEDSPWSLSLPICAG